MGREQPGGVGEPGARRQRRVPVDGHDAAPVQGNGQHPDVGEGRHDGVGPEVGVLLRLAAAGEADGDPARLRRGVELGRHVREEDEAGRDAERVGDPPVRRGLPLGAGVRGVEVVIQQLGQVADVRVPEPGPLARDGSRRERRQPDAGLVPRPQRRCDVVEERRDQVPGREPLGPDLPLQGLQRGRLDVGVHPPVQDSDEVLDGRVIGQPALAPYVRDGAAYDRVVAVGADPGAKARPGVVVERPEHGGRRAGGALDVEDDARGCHLDGLRFGCAHVSSWVTALIATRCAPERRGRPMTFAPMRVSCVARRERPVVDSFG